MHLPRNHRLAPALLLVLACSGKTGAPPSPPTAPVIVASTAARTPAPEPLRLAREIHSAPMAEVTLAPGGDAAITLDTDGGARLWPDLWVSSVAPPVRLPFQEPTWVSLARAGADRFVIAAIDTAGGVRIGEVELVDDDALWRPNFELPATDPQLEIHVLDGGERLLALSLDHRLRLFDRAGDVLAIVDDPGLIPWQLRIAHQPAGPPKLVAILGDPVRAQPITLDGDTLTITGEPRRIDLDRAPNRNDLILSPDGAFVTSLRRPRAEGSAWSLELIDLATEARRWIAGDVDNNLRPRLYLVDPWTALLESGTGDGHLVDLTAARVLPAPVDRAGLPRTRAAVIPLAGSTEESRMFADFAAGVRVVAVEDELYVDPIDGRERRRITAAPFTPSGVAIDPAGERLAWFTRFDVWLSEVGAAGPQRALGESLALAIEAAFLDSDRVLVATADGDLHLILWSEGTVTTASPIQAPQRYQTGLFRRRPGGGGALALAPHDRRAPLEVIDIGADATAKARPMAADEHREWIELDRSYADRDAAAQRFGVDGPRRGDALLSGAIAGDRVYAVLEGPLRIDELRGGSIRSLPLDHETADRVLAAAERGRVAVQASTEAEGLTTVIVVDFDGGAPRRLWSRTFTGISVDYAWSADGQRLALATREGGFVVDGATGQTLLEHRHLALEVEVLPPRAITRAPMKRRSTGEADPTAG